MRERYVIRFDLDMRAVADAFGVEGIALLGAEPSRQQEEKPSWLEFLDLQFSCISKYN